MLCLYNGSQTMVHVPLVVQNLPLVAKYFLELNCDGKIVSSGKMNVLKTQQSWLQTGTMGREVWIRMRIFRAALLSLWWTTIDQAQVLMATQARPVKCPQRMRCWLCMKVVWKSVSFSAALLCRVAATDNSQR